VIDTGLETVSTGIATRAASLDSGVRVNSCLMNWLIMPARPSEVLSSTLPTKPSHTHQVGRALEDVVAFDVAVEVDLAGRRRDAQQLAGAA